MTLRKYEISFSDMGTTHQLLQKRKVSHHVTFTIQLTGEGVLGQKLTISEKTFSVLDH